MFRKTFILAVSLACAGCEKSPMPSHVQKLAKAAHLVDDRLYIQRQGKLTIRPTTKFCSFRKGFHLDGIVLSNALEHHKQSASPERTNGIAGESDCKAPDTIYIYGFKSDNRQGRPYTLNYAVWQGHSASVITLTRPDGVRPGLEVAPVGAYVGLFHDYNAERLEQKSMLLDAQDITAALLKGMEWKS